MALQRKSDLRNLSYADGGHAYELPLTCAGSLVCPYCGKTFKLKRDMTRHIKSHTGQVHACPYCPYNYVRADRVRSHIITKHPEHCEAARESCTEEMVFFRGKP